MTEYQYLRAAEATITLVKSLQKQDMYKAVLSPISLRFTASTPANLSMSYCVPTKSSAGRCYIEMPSLYYFYETIQTYDDISRPSSDQSVRMFQVRNSFGISLVFVSFPSHFSSSRAACTGANILPLNLQHCSTNLGMPTTTQVLHLSKLLPRSLILAI